MVMPETKKGAGVILKSPRSQTAAQESISVGFAEIAVEELGYADDDTDFYGLSEAGCIDGGYRMVDLVEEHYISRVEHDRRVTELLREYHSFIQDILKFSVVRWNSLGTLLEKWEGE